MAMDPVPLPNFCFRFRCSPGFFFNVHCSGVESGSQLTEGLTLQVCRFVKDCQNLQLSLRTESEGLINPWENYRCYRIQPNAGCLPHSSALASSGVQPQAVMMEEAGQWRSQPPRLKYPTPMGSRFNPRLMTSGHPGPVSRFNTICPLPMFHLNCFGKCA